MRRAHLVALAIAIALGACSADAGPSGPLDDLGASLPRDIGVIGECTLTIHGETPDGQCRADWVCKEAGVLMLECGAFDGGGGLCVCAAGGMLTPVDTRPPSCSDVAALTKFASAACGWRSL